MALVGLSPLSALAGCQPGVRERIFQGGRLGLVSLFTADRTPDALVFVLSDLQGWDAGMPVRRGSSLR
jgi:hypothetical protein